jgi:MFS family permease
VTVSEPTSRSFRVYWLARALSSLGDAFTFVAFPLLTYRLTGSLKSMALITSCAAVGTVVAGVFSGTLVDRFDRRRFLIACDALTALLTAVLPIASWLGVLSVPLLAVMAVALRAVSNAAGVAYIAFIPELVPKASLTKANARLQGTTAMAFFAGPAVAGLTVQKWGPEVAIGLDALSFLLSLALLLVVVPAHPPEPPEGGRGKLAGLRFVFETPVLRTLAVLFAVETLATAGAFDLFTFHMKNELSGSDGVVGFTYALASLGGVSAALAASWVRERVGMFHSFIVSSLVLCVVFAMMPRATSVLLTVLLAMGFAFSSLTRGILSISRRQEVTPGHLLGRVTSVFWLIVELPRPIGAMLVSLVAARYGSSVVCMGIAVVLFLLAIGTTRARSLREV